MLLLHTLLVDDFESYNAVQRKQRRGWERQSHHSDPFDRLNGQDIFHANDSALLDSGNVSRRSLSDKGTSAPELKSLNQLLYRLFS